MFGSVGDDKQLIIWDTRQSGEADMHQNSSRHYITVQAASAQLSRIIVSVPPPSASMMHACTALQTGCVTEGLHTCWMQSISALKLRST